MSGSNTTANVVLVHGAWADGSSWAQVIKPLQSRGLKVLAVPIPRRGVLSRKAASGGAPTGSRSAWFPVDARGPIWHRLLSARFTRGGLAPRSNAASYRACVYSGKGAAAGVEDKALLVPDCSRRSDDQPGYTAVFGATDGCADSIGRDRSCTTGYRPRIGRRNNTRCRNRLRGSSEYLERRCAAAPTKLQQTGG